MFERIFELGPMLTRFREIQVLSSKRPQVPEELAPKLPNGFWRSIHRWKERFKCRSGSSLRFVKLLLDQKLQRFEKVSTFFRKFFGEKIATNSQTFL